MSLTISDGPLSAREPAPTNYEIEGPKHRLMWGEFPRRVRAEVDGRTVLDTTEGRLLHESMMPPVLYVPAEALDWDLLEPTETTTHCPFKGDASYWAIRAGERTVEDAVWTYPETNPEASWLDGHYGIYFERFDRWLDEDEEVRGDLRDPFHRIDVRPSSRAARVTAGDTVIASSERPWVLSETGLANRFYIPASDIDRELLVESETRTHCQYKGDATYWHLDLGGRRLEDAAWSYPEPFDEAAPIVGALCFDHSELRVDSD